MTEDGFRLALIAEVFHDGDGPRRLGGLLREAATAGARLAVLPELPLNSWAPAIGTPREEDAEPPAGPRHGVLAAAARAAGIAVLGGAIVRHQASGRRENRALLFDPRGELVHSYAKVHLPEEEGFWETSHYEPGLDPPRRIDRLEVPLGVQICSDTNRPEGFHMLAAAGVELVLVPRATEAATWRRWRTVLQANAITSACYVATVNRPRPEAGVALGGPSALFDPDGEIVAECAKGICVAEVHRDAVAAARRRYPGYVAWHPELYASGWRSVTVRNPR